MTNLVDRVEFASLLNEPNAADASNVKYFVLDVDSFILIKEPMLQSGLGVSLCQ